jgi:hypothetical protein
MHTSRSLKRARRLMRFSTALPFSAVAPSPYHVGGIEHLYSQTNEYWFVCMLLMAHSYNSEEL